jgi:hypothetical protein
MQILLTTAHGRAPQGGAVFEQQLSGKIINEA